MMYEQSEQIAFNSWMCLANPKVLWTATCGGLRTTWKQAVNMKRMGYKKGICDVLIFEPRGKYHGLCIEMKKSMEQGKGIVSQEQLQWLHELGERGYKAVVCYGCEEAIKVVSDYILKGE